MSPATAAERLETILTGEQIMGDGEPTTEQAAELIRQLMSAGTVARLDLVHGALLAAYRAGRTAEHLEVQGLADDAAAAFRVEGERLAREHAAAFTAAVQQRAQQQAERDARPWNLQ